MRHVKNYEIGLNEINQYSNILPTKCGILLSGGEHDHFSSPCLFLFWILVFPPHRATFIFSNQSKHRRLMLKTLGRLSTSYRMKCKHLSLALKVLQNLIWSYIPSFSSCQTSPGTHCSPSRIAQVFPRYNKQTHTSLVLHILFLPFGIPSLFFSSGKTCLQFKTCIKCHLLWEVFLATHMQLSLPLTSPRTPQTLGIYRKRGLKYRKRCMSLHTHSQQVMLHIKGMRKYAGLPSALNHICRVIQGKTEGVWESRIWAVQKSLAMTLRYERAGFECHVPHILAFCSWG